MNLGAKIKTLREERGLTQVELAKLSDTSRASIQLYEADKVNIPVKNLEKIANALSVGSDYFLSSNMSSKEIKFVEQSQNLSSNMSPNPTKLKPSHQDNEQVNIIKLSSDVGAGESVDIDGIEVYDTDILVPFAQMLFKTRITHPQRLRCMQVSGYSMVPMLFPDSWVIADVTAKFEDDGLYIVNYAGKFMVKLLQKSPDGVLHIKSVNKEYDSYDIGPNSDTQVYIIGKVLRCVI